MADLLRDHRAAATSIGHLASRWQDWIASAHRLTLLRLVAARAAVNRIEDDGDQQTAAREPEDEAERAVERADPAVAARGRRSAW